MKKLDHPQEQIYEYIVSYSNEHGYPPSVREICTAVGEDNVVSHTVDLTSDDGLKDYGKVERRCSLLTADMYRRYIDILDKFKPDSWWWLATPHSTKRHENDSWVKCVSPSGFIFYGGFYFRGSGVRPFCILKSNIFVSA